MAMEMTGGDVKMSGGRPSQPRNSSPRCDVSAKTRSEMSAGVTMVTGGVGRGHVVPAARADDAAGVGTEAAETRIVRGV